MAKSKRDERRIHLQYVIASLSAEVPNTQIPALATVKSITKLIDSDQFVARFLFQVDDYLHQQQISIVDKIRFRVSTFEEEPGPLPSGEVRAGILDRIFLNSAGNNAQLARILREAWNASASRTELLEYVFDQLLNSKYENDTDRLLPMWQEFYSLDAKRRRVIAGWYLLIDLFNPNQSEIELPKQSAKAGKDMIEQYIHAIEKIKMASPSYDMLWNATGIQERVWKRFLTDPAWVLFLTGELKKKVGYRSSKDAKNKILWQTAYAHAETLAYELAGDISTEGNKKQKKLKKISNMSDLPEGYDFDRERRDGGKTPVRRSE